MRSKKTTLPNGLRILTIPTKGQPAMTVMLVAEAGSHYEKKDENGISHFLEHMCFKGTELRPTSSIIHRELDGLGAQSNAVTTNEFTAYYAKAEKQHWKKALELLADLYMNPIFPKADIEKERGVILQEISMYEDQPHMGVWEELYTLMYGDTPAGRPITGSKESVGKLSRKDFVDYHEKYYVAKKTILVIAGDIPEGQIKKEANRVFKEMPRKKPISKPRVTETQAAPALKIKERKTDQMHMVMAFRAFPSKDPRTAALEVLAALLGGGFSSRLFEKLRDEMGACYYVRAGADHYSDHGALAISTGIDPARAEEVVRVILAECKRLTEEEIPEEDLKRTQDYVAGNMYLQLETTDALAQFYVVQEVENGRLESPQEREKAIRAVTAGDIQKVARDVFKNEHLNLALIGSLRNKQELKKALSF